MCGKYGCIKGINHNPKDQIKQRAHKGPDNISHFQDENIYLGHTRLSILDLTSDAHQLFGDQLTARYQNSLYLLFRLISLEIWGWIFVNRENPTTLKVN